jgi:hypothetical protein
VDRRWIALFGALAALHAAPAAAASLSLTTSPANPSDRAQLQILADGTTDAVSTAAVRVHYKREGTGQCGASPDADGGTAIEPDGVAVGPGEFHVAGALQSFTPGGYLVCGWLMDTSGAQPDPLAATALHMAVAASDALALTISDPDPVQGRALDLHATGTSYDADAAVFATSKANGGTCAGTAPADTGTSLDPAGFAAGSGAFDIALSTQQVYAPGAYLLCSWLVDTRRGSNEPLATATKTLTVRALSPTLGFTAPPRVDALSQFTATLRTHVDHDVPVEAVVNQKPLPGGSCAPSPKGEPTSVKTLSDTQITDTQQPAGDVSVPMQGQLEPGAYLLCAWLIPAWHGAAPDAVLAGPLSAAVTAVKPRTYKGRTSQHLSIRFVISAVAHQILQIDYTDKYRCGRGKIFFNNGQGWWNGVYTASLNTTNFGALKAGADGRFKANLNAVRDNRFAIRGRLDGNTVTGSMHGTGKSNALVNTNQRRTCRTGTVKFTARRR